MKEKINLKDYAQRITDALPHSGVLLNTNGDKFNAMVIGWGSLGTCWGVPTFTVYVREHRYTKAQLDKTQEFTISIPLEKVPIIRIAYADHSLKHVSPLPLLFSFGSHAKDEKYSGLWIGDSIEGSNVLPSKEYKDISNIYTWDH